MKKDVLALFIIALAWSVLSQPVQAEDVIALDHVPEEKVDKSSESLSEGFLSREKVELGVHTSFRYDSNHDLVSANEEESFTFNLSPHLKYWLVGTSATENQFTIFYNPTLGFSTDDNQFSADQKVELDYSYDSEVVLLDLGGSFEFITGENARDVFDVTNAQLLREERSSTVHRYTAYAGFEYVYSPLLTWAVTPTFKHYDYSGNLNDLTQADVDTTLYYTFASGTARLGPEFGYSKVDSQNNPDQDAYRVGSRFEWDYSNMTTLYAFVGAEYRDFSAGGGSNWEPIGSFGVDWAPDELIKVSLSYERIISPSSSAVNQNYVADIFSVAVYKAFLENYFVNLKGSYTFSEYESTAGGVVNREDDYWSIYGDLGRNLFDGHARVSIFYIYTENDSNLNTSDFNNHGAGVQFSWDL